jgi:hypothetical protein
MTFYFLDGSLRSPYIDLVHSRNSIILAIFPKRKSVWTWSSKSFLLHYNNSKETLIAFFFVCSKRIKDNK